MKRSPTNCIDCESKDQNPFCSVDNAIPEIERVRTVSTYKPGQVLFYVGNDPLGLFTIQNGLVKLEVTSPEGTAHTLRLVGSGGVLGYRSLFSGEPYHATAVALEETTVCFVPRADVLNIFQMNPQIALNLVGYLSKNLRAAEEKWMTQMDKEAPARVAEAVVFLDASFKNKNWTRREIAEWAGTTPETVMRTLAQFEKQGLVELQGRAILIRDKEKLVQKAH